MLRVVEDVVEDQLVRILKRNPAVIGEKIVVGLRVINVRDQERGFLVVAVKSVKEGVVAEVEAESKKLF